MQVIPYVINLPMTFRRVKTLVDIMVCLKQINTSVWRWGHHDEVTKVSQMSAKLSSCQGLERVFAFGHSARSSWLRPEAFDSFRVSTDAPDFAC